MRSPLLPALLAVSALALASCSAAPEASGAGGGSEVVVVASTNVYGDLAGAVGGDRVAVSSIIDNAAQDPHSYEAGPRDRLAVQKADLVVENGGGYDAFMQQLREGSDAVVITAAEFSQDYPGADDHHDEGDADEAAAGEAGHDHEGHDHLEGFNEHVWFDPHTVSHVVEQIADELSGLDPDGAEDYAANADEVIDELSGFQTQLEDMHDRLEGTPVLMTEPLPGYLAAAAGLDDVTPEGFAAAVEEGDDVPPATLLAAQRLIEGGEVAAVLGNAQTGGSETERIEAAAQTAGIPVVTFSELLEADQSYAEWMHDAIRSLADALEK